MLKDTKIGRMSKTAGKWLLLAGIIYALPHLTVDDFMAFVYGRDCDRAVCLGY